MSPHLPWAYGIDEIRFRAESLSFGPEALSELLENVPVALAVTLSREHRYVFANRLFRAGLGPGAGDVIGKTVEEVFGEAYSPEARAMRTRVLETGEPCDISDVPLRSGGEETVYWDVKLLPVRDADDQISGILTLAANVTERVRARAEAERRSREAAIYNERLALAVEATELGLWEWDARTGEAFWSDRQKEIFGLPIDQPGTYEYWTSAIHPEDRKQVIEAVTGLMDPASGGQLRLEHRVVHPNGDIRWILSRGRMLYEIVNGTLQPARLLGTVLDITERRESEEAKQLLARELNHRVKNLFAVASGMVSMTARNAASPKDMAATLRGRLDALARAHELIHPAVAGTDQSGRAASVELLIQTVLAPHLDPSGEDRLSCSGPDVATGPGSATALTLVLHELATNATKYGALSVPEGRLRVTWTRDGPLLRLLWQESGGPSVAGEPALQGFGSQLAIKSVTGQLGGEFVRHWLSEGLRVDIVLPVERLAR